MKEHQRVLKICDSYIPKKGQTILFEERIMLGEQTRTYLLYSRGLMPDDLTLGSLHLDPANPIDDENKVLHHTAP